MRRILFFLLGLAACSRTPSEPPTGVEPSSPGTAAASATVTAPSPHARPPTPLASLKWDDPARWERRKPSSAMRRAEYLVPRAAGDSDDAECTVFTFGPGQGGSADDNIERWVKQLEPTSAAPVRTTRSVNGMTVTRVEVGGTFTPMQMPGAPPATGPHKGWRLIGVVVDTPGGPWFFKVTGPDATVKAAAKELDALVDSARPG
jgi:hypothetical protein